MQCGGWLVPHDWKEKQTEARGSRFHFSPSPLLFSQVTSCEEVVLDGF